MGETARYITLHFTVQEAEAILAGLVKLPMEVSRDLFDRIKAEAIAQVQSKEAEQVRVKEEARVVSESPENFAPIVDAEVVNAAV